MVEYGGEPPVESILRLPFQKHFFTEFFVNESVLLVLARGLGLPTFIRQVVDFFVDPHFLVVLLGLDPQLETSLLLHYQTREPFPHFQVAGSSVTGDRRTQMYSHCGVISVSSQMFLIDVLRDQLPSNLVSCVLLCNAHTLDEDGMEAFGLYVLKRKNPQIMVKAITDRPELVVNRIERLAKLLYVKAILLAPRFDPHVIESFSATSDVQFKEIRQPLSQRQRLIQVCLSDLLNSARKDLIKSTNNVLENEGDDDEISPFTNEVILADKFEGYLAKKLSFQVLSLRALQVIEEVRILR